ncbi:DUF4399 domain-containing protein [Hyphomicrobium sulfonivorans]|uniref:DUF4399 domain-containing protein n=1 Tax=Hyphomicrobium sulfonivorans TaxID=121290 RepID=UPI001570A18F|nr:DUF4399 domain-containing protein [Hyphomicrobium sulfonivorans]MBI1649773.1 DUF4399 domain-containing protein [Hyphomicrobium sulfonivorans]NSL71689.1 rod shape-determining protein RodA [Hyphomicrobium sulfonivorans]
MRSALAATLLVLGLAACGDNSTSTTPAPTAHEEVHQEGTPLEEASARTPSPAGARVFLIEPANGATVKSPVTVKFGIEGMDVAPAGSETPNSGHHHLLIDADLQDYDAPIPSDDQHRHFGKAQTEATIELAPGQHTLRSVLGDKNHIPHDPPVQSDVITITVEE